MTAELVCRNAEGFTVQVTIPYVDSMLKFEEANQDSVNQGGKRATQEALERFDSDGSPIQFGSTKFFTTGQEPEGYQTLSGLVKVNRHECQSAKGGKTFCPMEKDARIIIASTPKFAKMVTSKYAELGSSRVQMELLENHGRSVPRSFIQTVTDAVSAVVEAKEDQWRYQEPVAEKSVHSIGIGMDGTMMLLCEDGCREVMVETIALYDREGIRQHTTYLAASPECGKSTFLAKLESEIQSTKAAYPDAHYVGVAD